MHTAPKPFRTLQEGFQRGNHRDVLARGEHAVATLDAGDDTRAYVGPAMLLIGASLAQVEHHREAISWLEQGLARVTEAGAHPGITDVHWFHRALAGLYLLIGDQQRAEPYLEWLARPQQSMESRLTAARGLAAIATLRGDDERAQWQLNTATDLVRRMRSNLLSAIVDADRAIIAAARSHLREAVDIADRVGPSLAAPADAAEQRWANAQATTMYTSLARRLALAGDLMTAERMLLDAAVPAAESRRSYAASELELARGVVWREEGDLDRAEPAIDAALRQFDALGTAPALAIALVESSRLARRRGLDQTAASTRARAEAELRRLGMVRDLVAFRTEQPGAADRPPGPPPSDESSDRWAARYGSRS